MARQFLAQYAATQDALPVQSTMTAICAASWAVRDGNIIELVQPIF